MKFHSFEVSQLVKAPRTKVFRAWTNVHLAKQFAAPPGCRTKKFQIQFHVGGKYSLTMETPHGTMKNSGEYLDIQPGRKIIQTFVWDAPETEMNVIVLEFKDRGKNTVMKLKGHGFSVKGEASGNREGWKASLAQFAEHFA